MCLNKYKYKKKQYIKIDIIIFYIFKNKMIEKNLFQTWFTKDLHPNVQQVVDKIKALNPEYTYRIFDDAEMDQFVNEHYSGEIADCYNRLNIIVAKADFWRYLVIYKYGGVYLDMDASIDRPLCELIKDEDEAIITAEGNPDAYVQWCMMYKKEHPILKRAIEIVVNNIKNNTYPNDVVNMTGPWALTRAFNEIQAEMFGKVFNQRDITRSTDITFSNVNISYRIYGIDYSEFGRFKHDFIGDLYYGKTYWRIDQDEKSLLLPIP